MAMTIAIVIAYGYATANIEADLIAYRSNANLPACTVANGCLSLYQQNGGPFLAPKAIDSGWASELALDLDMASAGCPLCNLSVFVADDPSPTSMSQAVRSAAASGAKYVSMSWGAKASPMAMVVDDLDERYGQWGGDVLYFAASGDDGYSATTLEYPAMSNGVIAVGATALSRDVQSERGWSEVAWTGRENGPTNSGGPSSGCGSNLPQPAWQAGVVPRSACEGVAVADISAVGSSATPVLVRYDGKWWGFAGTSAAAPLVAGIYAAAGVRTTTAAALTHMYANRHVFNDVLAGGRDNCGSTALCLGGAGWDGPTGIGTPDGSRSFDDSPPPPPEGTADLAPIIAVTSDNGEIIGDSLVATLTPGGDPLTVHVDDFGDYDAIRFNVTAEPDGDAALPGLSQRLGQCTASKGMPSGLSLSDCVLHGAVGGDGDYSISVTKDANGDLVWTVTVVQPPGEVPPASSSAGVPPTNGTPPSSNPPPNEPPRAHKTYVVDVRVKVVLAELVGVAAKPDGRLGTVDPTNTILRDIVSPDRDLTPRQAVDVLGQLSAVEGLTPAYTPRTVMMIRLAQLLKALLPFD